MMKISDCKIGTFFSYFNSQNDTVVVGRILEKWEDITVYRDCETNKICAILNEMEVQTW